VIKHDSMRGWFAYELYQQMKKDKDIILLVGDLGYGMFDSIRDELPDQFINCGAAENGMMGIAVGLALEGKKPFVYSITTFLLFRPFETIKLYLDGENIPVRLIGSGRDKDYAHDGPSHDATKAYDLFGGSQNPNGFFWNIWSYWPETKEEIPDLVEKMVKTDRPQFISLRR